MVFGWCDLLRAFLFCVFFLFGCLVVCCSFIGCPMGAPCLQFCSPAESVGTREETLSLALLADWLEGCSGCARPGADRCKPRSGRTGRSVGGPVVVVGDRAVGAVGIWCVIKKGNGGDYLVR